MLNTVKNIIGHIPASSYIASHHTIKANGKKIPAK